MSHIRLCAELGLKTVLVQIDLLFALPLLGSGDLVRLIAVWTAVI